MLAVIGLIGCSSSDLADEGGGQSRADASADASDIDAMLDRGEDREADASVRERDAMTPAAGSMAPDPMMPDEGGSMAPDPMMPDEAGSMAPAPEMPEMPEMPAMPMMPEMPMMPDAAGSMAPEPAMPDAGAMEPDPTLPDAGGMEPEPMLPDAGVMQPLDAGAMEDDAGAEMPEPTMDAGHQHPPDDSDGGVDPMPDPGTNPAAEHCSMSMGPDPRDQTLDPTPVVLPVGTSQDLALPQGVVDWMTEHGWEPAHDAWHTTRSWDARCGTSFAPAEGCRYAENLVSEGLWRAEFQQGAPGSGLAFLHMHRHMLDVFRAAFPSHPELFRGFTHVPRTQDDPENQTPWRALTWSENSLIGFDILENIEENLDMFPTEDDLGMYIETAVRWSAEDPSFRTDTPGVGVHGALHREWTVFGSPASLGGTSTSLENYTFWKLHGWIDDVWSRYRAAKGLSDQDPDYLAVRQSECELMYYYVTENRALAPASLRD